MDITAQVEANWKASPFLFFLKGTGRDVLWVGGDTVWEKRNLGRDLKRFTQYLESCFVLSVTTG